MAIFAVLSSSATATPAVSARILVHTSILKNDMGISNLVKKVFEFDRATGKLR